MFVIVEIWQYDLATNVKVYGPYDTENEAENAIYTLQSEGLRPDELYVREVVR